MNVIILSDTNNCLKMSFNFSVDQKFLLVVTYKKKKVGTYLKVIIFLYS